MDNVRKKARRWSLQRGMTLNHIFAKLEKGDIGTTDILIKRCEALKSDISDI